MLELCSKRMDFNKRITREIIAILIIKVIILLVIKNIWFTEPTIPKNFDNQVAERIAGDTSINKETR